MVFDNSLIEIQFENFDSILLKGGKEATLFVKKYVQVAGFTKSLTGGILSISGRGGKKKSKYHVRLLDYLKEGRIITNIIIRPKKLFRKNDDIIANFVIPMDDTNNYSKNKYQSFRESSNTYFVEINAPEETGETSK